MKAIVAEFRTVGIVSRGRFDLKCRGENSVYKRLFIKFLQLIQPMSNQRLTDEERTQLADKLDKELDDFINVLSERSVGY